MNDKLRHFEEVGRWFKEYVKENYEVNKDYYAPWPTVTQLAISGTTDGGDWIIIVENANGRLAPAIHPKRYHSESQAKAVALSMAQKHPGEKFFILKIVGEAFLPPQQPTVTMF